MDNNKSKMEIIMKKIVLISMLGLLLFGCGQAQQDIKEDIQIEEAEQSDAANKDNVENQNNTDESDIDEKSNQKETNDDIESDQKQNTGEEQKETKNNDFTFADVSDIEFAFSSGAGGWSTYLYIEEDGRFYGNFHDSDMGCTGEGYPGGTIYYCDFSGKFTNPVKIDDDTYQFEIESLKCEKEEGEEEIIDEILYIYSYPYGMDDADKLYMYLPGKDTKDFSEELQMWLFLTDNEKELPFYALYNENPEYGFVGYQYEAESVYDKIMEDLEKVKEETDEHEESLKSGLLSQIEMNQTSQTIFTCWDNELNSIWNDIKLYLPEEEYNQVLSEQREWIQKKDAKAEADAADCEGGSLYPTIYYGSEAESTRERCYELVEYLKDY